MFSFCRKLKSNKFEEKICKEDVCWILSLCTINGKRDSYRICKDGLIEQGKMAFSKTYLLGESAFIYLFILERALATYFTVLFKQTKQNKD